MIGRSRGFSIGGIRLGSKVSIVAILIVWLVDTIAKRIGTPDALWVDVVEWLALAVISHDILHALTRLSPRKQWLKVMIIGVGAGIGALVVALILWLDADSSWSIALVSGILFLLLGGGLGFFMWRHEVQKVNSYLLEKKLQRKKRISL